MPSPPTFLSRPLSEVPGVSAHAAKQLGKEALETIGDLLWQLPFRHEDRRQMQGSDFQPSETPACHFVVVGKTRSKFFGARGSGVFEAQVEPLGGAAMGQGLTLRWWNMPFMKRSIAEGLELVIYGKIKEWRGQLFMDHPEFEILDASEEDGAKSFTGRITPVYRLKGGLTMKNLRIAVWQSLQLAGEESFIADLLPTPSPTGEFAGWNRSKALRAAHFPDDDDELRQARRYLALEEFYTYQLRVVKRRRLAEAAGGRPHVGDGALTSQLAEALPFQLTPAQQRCLEEIWRDMATAMPMNRLLHGDVGSGKTIVAFMAMLRAVESGSQAALMAPTQILAEQHFQNARRWLEPLGLRVALRTGTRKTDGDDATLWTGGTSDTSRPPEILIGTHALLHDRKLLTNAGLVVIDEQHKFGVAQRARLIQKGNTPDVLVMTATPIPRTLTLTLYGDLDISTIDERPKERGKIITKVRSIGKRADAITFLREQLEADRQAYLVYPLIEDSEKLDAAAATKGFAEWAKALEPFSVGLLHGKMPPEEKDAVMRDFRENKLQALVSTTVIEVGVDVPNATVMYLHNAERFGLAQLHQLRGRIGRGSHTSYCILFIKDDDEEARQRFAIMEETQDGFRIAEEDLLRRGPGDVLGKAQSGQAPLRFAELLADTRLVRIARTLAERTLDEDPDLQAARFDGIRKAVTESETTQATLQ